MTAPIQIVVCVRQTPSPTGPFEFDPTRGALNEQTLEYDASPADLVGVEAAVGIREGRDGSVTLITVGSPASDLALRKGLMLGADRALLIADESLAAGGALLTAAALAAAIRRLELPPDLVICGTHTFDGATGLVGAALAEQLGLPYVAGVVEIEPAGECLETREIAVRRRLERGLRAHLIAPLPVVLAVDVTLADPRYPTMPARLKAQRAAIPHWDAATIDLDAETVETWRDAATTLIQLAVPRPRTKRGFTVDSSLPAEQRLQLILNAGPKEAKSSSLLEGEPEEGAREVIAQLRARHFVG